MYTINKTVLNRMKIKTKLLCFIILTVCIACGTLYLFSIQIYTNAIENKTINYNMNQIDSMNKNIDSFFNQLEFLAYTVEYNPVIQSQMIFHKINSDEENIKKDNEIKNLLYTLGNLNNYLQLTIFPIDTKLNYYSSGYSTKSTYNYHNDYWYKTIQKSHMERKIYTDNPQAYFDDSSRKPVYTLVYKFRSFGKRNLLGYLLMDIDKDKIEQFYKNNNMEIKATFITEQNRKLIYSSNPDFKLDNISSYLPQNIKNGYVKRTIKGVKYLIVFKTSAFAGWKIINIISYDSLFKDIRLMKYVLLGVLCILLLVMMLITYKFTITITNPIEKLKNGMSEVMKGNFDSSIQGATEDEIGELIEYFNRMIYEIQSLIKEAESSKFLKKEAQLKSLQNQINPHFLYNTLEMIIGLADNADVDKVKKTCRSLGSMFRYNLSSKKIVTIQEEIEQIKRYLYIMELRFEGRFSTVYQIDEDVISNKTLKFFLQPLVENSISYGFNDLVDGGIIKIAIAKVMDKIEFCIIDNGKGFEKAVLDTLQEELDAAASNFSEALQPDGHIGIINVHLRFLMSFKQDYTIHITSIPNVETCIKIQIPIIP